MVFDSIFPRVLRKKREREREREAAGAWEKVNALLNARRREEERERERERENYSLRLFGSVVFGNRGREIIGATGRDRDELF